MLHQRNPLRRVSAEMMIRLMTESRSISKRIADRMVSAMKCPFSSCDYYRAYTLYFSCYMFHESQNKKYFFFFCRY